MKVDILMCDFCHNQIANESINDKGKTFYGFRFASKVYRNGVELDICKTCLSEIFEIEIHYTS